MEAVVSRLISSGNARSDRSVIPLSLRPQMYDMVQYCCCRSPSPYNRNRAALEHPTSLFPSNWPRNHVSTGDVWMRKKAGRMGRLYLGVDEASDHIAGLPMLFIKEGKNKWLIFSRKQSHIPLSSKSSSVHILRKPRPFDDPHATTSQTPKSQR